MKERSFDEMIAYFNRRVADMDISQDCKMELLGMVTALGYKHEKSAQQWIPCERELPDVGRSVLISVGGMYTAEGCLREDGDWTQFRWDAIQRKDMVGAWKPLDEPWKGEQP